MTVAPVDFAATSRFAAGLHYHEAGPASGESAAADPVVMLHGGGPGASAWSNFGRNLPAFAARFRTLLIDQPGFGRSDKPPVQGNYFTFSANAVAGLLDELGIGRVHLIGAAPLCALYADAIAACGGTAVTHDEDAAARGLARITQEAT